MKLKLSTLLFAAGALPSIVLAAPTVTFQGKVTAQTCQASINGTTDSIVLLPTVATGDFNGVGGTAGLTPFTITISNCQAPTSGALNVTTNYLGHNVTDAGNLGNIATGGNAATNVAIQLTSDAAGTNPVVLNGVTPVAGLILGENETSASYQFGAQYVADGSGTPTAGIVTAVAEYTISYP